MNQSQRPKRKYTAEFKADVLRLVANGEPIMAVARKMSISDSLIHMVLPNSWTGFQRFEAC